MMEKSYSIEDNNPKLPNDKDKNNRSALILNEPVNRGYKSIIQIMNENQNCDENNDGQKIKANYRESFLSSNGPTSYSLATSTLKRKKNSHLFTHSKTLDDTLEVEVSFGQTRENRKLVRQKGTTKNDFYKTISNPIDWKDNHSLKSISKAERTLGMPPRQWTVDACTGLKPIINDLSSTYQSKIKNTQHESEYKYRISGQRSKSKVPLKFSTLNRSIDGQIIFPGSEIYYHPRRQHLVKQRTTESAPNCEIPLKLLMHQDSNISSCSTILPKFSSQQGIKLVRGASCSLVDIPSYLGPSITSAGGFEVIQNLNLQDQSNTGSIKESLISETSQSQNGSNARQRLQINLQRKNSTTVSSPRKTRWTVLCISLTLLTLSVTVVGTMLSVGSQYQDMLFSKNMNHKNNLSLHNFLSDSNAIIWPDEIKVSRRLSNEVEERQLISTISIQNNTSFLNENKLKPSL